MAPLYYFAIAGAKVGVFYHISKLLREKMHVFRNFAVSLHSLLSNRDVAQLVAYYVRDVGVGRSNRLIPTKIKVRGCKSAPYLLVALKYSDRSRTVLVHHNYFSTIKILVTIQRLSKFKSICQYNVLIFNKITVKTLARVRIFSYLCIYE